MNNNGNVGRRLNHAVVALGMSLVVLTSATAYAGILATGPVYGGPTQFSANCYASNIGAAPITVVSGEIRYQSGDIESPNLDTCTGKTLHQFQTCAMGFFPLTGQTYECDFRTGGTTANLRGVMDMRDVNEKVLINSDLR